MAQILLVDDDQTILTFVRFVLEAQGHQVLMATHGSQALELFFEHKPDLILLDIMMPEMSGIDVCNQIRERAPLIPIIFLTARQQVHDLVSGFDSGADDYITKPFKLQELQARVQAALRRVEQMRRLNHTSHKDLQLGDLKLDITACKAEYLGEALSLSRTEFKLLQVLCEQADRILGRELLLHEVWGYRVDAQSRTLDNFVGRLRRKLQKALAKHNTEYPRIETVYGQGYRLSTQEVEPPT